MPASLAPSDLALLRDAEEVRIETTAGEGRPVHRTIIWVMVDALDRVLIRSFLGPSARWYREVMAQPDCRLEVGNRMLNVRTVPATDAERVTACSDELRRKYAGHGSSLTGMLRDETLPTTLELLPR
ncbi:MAG: DUF2255 family protein [Gemmatimonadales bacterium]